MFFSCWSPKSLRASRVCRLHPPARAPRRRRRLVGQTFKTGCDDHAVAHQVVTFRHYLALVHANTQAHQAGLGTQHILDRDGAVQRLHSTGKLHQEAVVLYGLVILRLERRRLVWTNVATNPTAEWIARQITEAFPWDDPPRYLLRDRDTSYGAAVTRRLRTMGIRDRPILPRSPWQNGHVERLIGSIRR